MTSNVIWDLQVFSTEQKHGETLKLLHADRWLVSFTSHLFKLNCHNTSVTCQRIKEASGDLDDKAAEEEWEQEQRKRGGRWSCTTLMLYKRNLLLQLEVKVSAIRKSENIRRERLTSGRQAGAASAGWSESSSPEESPWKHNRMIQDGGIKMNCTTQMIHFWDKRTTWEREAGLSVTVCVFNMSSHI